SAYNATEPVPGPYNLRMLLVKRARMEGFIIFDYRDRYAEATARLAQWVEEGKITYAEDVVDGLEQAPKVINRLFDGANTGKLIIRISDEP
ncbi:MAG: zinc-binding dehydrogenase, partial [Proteobacteria bacterium]|nr:zinc-binding dehydrogenase [Pseudomonadota bacterium]